LRKRLVRVKGIDTNAAGLETTIAAFSGEHEYGGEKVTKATLDGFISNKIVNRIGRNPGLPEADI
jgi:hypothetical protein